MTNTTHEVQSDVGRDTKAGKNRVDIEASETASSEAVATETVSVSKKSHKGLYAILVVLLIAAAALISPAQFKALFHTVSEKLVPEHVAQTPASAPVAAVVQPVEVQLPKPQKIEPEPIMAEEPSVSSEEIQHLLHTIDDLRGELGQLGSDQRKLRAALHEQQRMNLQVRLRWVVDPAARLPQMQLAWEEISLLPGLSDEQRSLAVQMHALAQADVERLHQWRLAIQKWADTLSVPAHEDILPRPEHPWLAWVVSQFHLRQAPSMEARKLSDMRQRLLETTRLLTLESWPEAGAWQRLRAELLLQVKAHAKDTEAAVELGLPDDFSAIQQDIQSLRQNARAWLEQY